MEKIVAYRVNVDPFLKPNIYDFETIYSGNKIDEIRFHFNI